jgi:NADH-quinone oxidoreductase subunit C
MDPQLLKNQFPKAVTEAFFDQEMAAVRVVPSELHSLLKGCKNDPQFKFEFLMDIVGVDYLDQEPRFELVYLLYSYTHNHRLRLHVRLNENEEIPTASDLWASADWAEREVWDMFGIKFSGHANLKRILLFEGFKGHPLRKDYPISRRQEIPEIEEKL